MRYLIFLALLVTTVAYAHAEVTFQWTHDGLDTNNQALMHANQELAFQIEYSIDGGAPAYVDVAAGSWTNATTPVRSVQRINVLCDQRVTARVRADYRGQQSVWSAQAQSDPSVCPTPGSPANMTITISWTTEGVTVSGKVI